MRIGPAALKRSGKRYPGKRSMTTPNFVDNTTWTGENLDIMRGINNEAKRE